MNFTDLLSWISGKKPETKVSPMAETREKRRFYRINLSEGEVFIGESGPFQLVNVSYGGVRVKVAGHELSKTAQIGQKFDSRIKLGRIQFSCSVKVCNLGKDEVGCAFENLAPAHSRMVSEYLRPRILGSSLQEINASSLQNREPNLRLRWFQGDEGAQIFLWQTLEGDVVKEEFYFFDYIITWDHSQKVLQTGA